jgi:hypothetical protein
VANVPNPVPNSIATTESAPVAFSVRAMAGRGTQSTAPEPSAQPLQADDLDAGDDVAPTDDYADGGGGDGDGGASIWQMQPGGYQVATFNRYYAQRSFVLLGDGTAAIAMPGQVDALLSAMARRGPAMEDTNDPRLITVLEVEGARNLISLRTWHGEFPIPRRASLALYALADATGRQTGEESLVSNWQYDSPAEAEHARQEMEYSRGRWHMLIAASFGSEGGLARFATGLLAGAVTGVDVNSLERAIDALQFRVEGNRLNVRATFSYDQARSVMKLISLRSRLNTDALGANAPQR